MPFAALVLLYPGCRTLVPALTSSGPSPAQPSGPVLLMHGTADLANTVDDCRRLAEILAENNEDVRVTAWPGGTYAWNFWDEDRPDTTPHPTPGGGPAVLTEPRLELAEMSATRAAAFLAAVLSRAGP